jgi:ADP-ribose pyrophosphatase YjhB (NUDIX family)
VGVGPPTRQRNGKASAVSPKTRRVDYWRDPQAPKPTNRKASASVVVRDEDGRVLLLRRTDNDLWTIPTGAVKRGETVAEAAVRECREETGLEVEITGIVGVFSNPDHVIAYVKGDKVKEVRQPINVCLHARQVGGEPTRTKEAAEVAWVATGKLDRYNLHPAIRLRLSHGLSAGQPYVE